MERRTGKGEAWFRASGPWSGARGNERHGSDPAVQDWSGARGKERHGSETSVLSLNASDRKFKRNSSAYMYTYA
jgi:hypothetical protein